ncbi:MAG: lipopolysaccharide heptosyltransferase II [Omnitrophica bacterium RIFCSPLOWO2_12_FULL_50_11]|nr:MAG: lipopolysaccharide heptosyltransferase II [Omnitrophica bacterium RIFCSPLOWO2_12_FULL_50_11]
MRIAQILPELNVGGVETGTVDLAKALKKRGHEPFVISNGGTLVDELVKAGIPHLQLPVHRKSIVSLRLVREIVTFIERERIDVIHARSRVPAWLAYLSVRRTDCDFVTTCHGYYSKHFLSRVMGWGKRVIVISHSIGRRMIDDFGVSPGRVRLIHRGVDLSQYRFSPDKYDRPRSGPFKIMNVGRITPIKGHGVFVRAVHLLSKRLQSIEVSIVGGPDRGKESYLQDLKTMVTRLGLDSHVKFLGVRKDVPELIREADLLVLASTIPEAFGRVLIEAGAVGTACMASRIGGILDIIDEEENGLLFSPENFEEMAITMERLLKDRMLAKRLALRLRAKVEREFTLEKMVDKTCQVYEEVRREKKVLITKLGAMGDLILAVPSFRMIRQRIPHAYIALLVDSKLMPLIQKCPYVDEFIAYDRSRTSSSWKRISMTGKWLRGRSFDLCIDLQNTWRTHVLAFLARIPKRYGYRRGMAGFLLTHPVVYWDHQLGPVAHQFQVLKRVGITHMDDRMELWLEPQADREITERFERAGVLHSKHLVGFVLGASRRWPTKQWPVDYFLELSRRLIRRFECHIVLIGTVEDQKLAEVFSGARSNHVLNETGNTTEMQLVSLIKRLDVLVTGDTAPLHVASAVGTKTVALFGPTDPKRHMPSGNGHVALVKRIPCQPCYRGTCKNKVQLQCLREITVDEVFHVVTQHLREPIRQK